MIKVDVHQHLWSAPLLDALSERSQLPFIRREHGLAILYLAGERPYVIDLSGEAPARRAALVERDGLDRALVCISSPLGIESLPREQSLALLDAYHEGALSLDGPFAVWGAIALDRPDAGDVDDALDRGCVGLSIPAGALAGVDELSRLHEILARLELRGAPLFIHPGPGTRSSVGARGPARQGRLDDPLWWPALTGYVADMHAAWLAFLTAGRLRHPSLRVIFSMLAGLAPLHAERLTSRGGPATPVSDPLVFYDTASYGASTARLVQDLVGAPQVLYGSDRPVVEPGELRMPGELDWDPIADGTNRALVGLQAVGAR
jgi:6-methylsalicylate decarboxylase